MYLWSFYHLSKGILEFSYELSSPPSGVSPGIRQARGEASRANHLQLQSGPAGVLKLSPSAPGSSKSDRQRQPADLPDHKPGFIPQLFGQGLREGGWGLHLESCGEGPCLTNYVLPKNKLYIFILFLIPLIFFLPPFHFEQGQCFLSPVMGSPYWCLPGV